MISFVSYFAILNILLILPPVLYYYIQRKWVKGAEPMENFTFFICRLFTKVLIWHFIWQYFLLFCISHFSYLHKYYCITTKTLVKKKNKILDSLNHEHAILNKVNTITPCKVWPSLWKIMNWY
jgi:hypothetical protein